MTANSTVHPLELRIREPHPFLMRFALFGRPWALRATAIGSLCAFLLCALADGNLTQPSLGRVLCQDGRSYLGAGNQFCSQYASSTQVSALRDVCGLVLIILLPMTVPLMFRQWEGITHFLSAMDDRKILRISDRAKLEQEVAAVNVYFRRAGALNPLVAAVAIVCMLFVVRAQTADAVYPTLPSGKGPAGIQPVDWWLTIEGTGLAGALYFLVGAAVIYLILLQNVHGSKVVALLWRVRKVVDFEADLSNPDGYHGWSEVRSILLATWSLTIIHGVCIGMVALSLPRGEAWALIPLFGQWLVVTPFYMTIPGWQTRRNIEGWKRRERVKIEASVALNPSHAMKSAAQHQIDGLRVVRVNPYARLLQRFFSYLGIIGSILLVIQILQRIYG